MRQILLTFILLTTLTNCNSVGQTSQINLQVPDVVTIVKNNFFTQIPGTRIFISIPTGYHLRKDLLRFEKDDNPSSYVQLIESPTTNFIENKHLILERLEDLKKKGFTCYYEKEFKSGDNSAIIIYGSSNSSAGQISLNFGNSKFSVTMAAEFPANEDNTRQIILNSMLSADVDESAVIDQTILQTYTLDISKSEFKFNSSMSSICYYTINGKGDPVNNPFENVILVMTLPALKSNEARKAYGNEMVTRYKNSGISIQSTNEKKIELNGINAYEISFSGSYQGKSLMTYQIVTGNSKCTILYCGMAYERQAVLIKQIKEIAQTLKIK